MASQEFISAMKEDCGAEIMEAMLDPKNQPLMEKGLPTRIPLDDNSAEVSFAMEVIPHLVSPAHFFLKPTESARPADISSLRRSMHPRSGVFSNSWPDGRLSTGSASPRTTTGILITPRSSGNTA